MFRQQPGSRHDEYDSIKNNYHDPIGVLYTIVNLSPHISNNDALKEETPACLRWQMHPQLIPFQNTLRFLWGAVVW